MFVRLFGKHQKEQNLILTYYKLYDFTSIFQSSERKVLFLNQSSPNYNQHFLIYKNKISMSTIFPPQKFEIIENQHEKIKSMHNHLVFQLNIKTNLI